MSPPQLAMAVEASTRGQRMTVIGYAAGPDRQDIARQACEFWLATGCQPGGLPGYIPAGNVIDLYDDERADYDEGSEPDFT